MVTTTIIAIVVIVVVLSDIIAVVDVVDGLSPSPSYLYNIQHQLFLPRITTRRTVPVMSATQKDDDDNDDDNDSDNLLRLATFSSADNNKKTNHNNDDDNDNDDDDKEEDGSVSNSSSSSSSSSSFKTVSQTIAKGAIGVAYTFSNILFNAVALFFVFGIILNVMGYGYEFRAAGGTTAEDGSGDFLHRIPILHVDTIEQIRTERQFDRTYLK